MLQKLGCSVLFFRMILMNLDSPMRTTRTTLRELLSIGLSGCSMRKGSGGRRRSSRTESSRDQSIMEGDLPCHRKELYLPRLVTEQLLKMHKIPNYPTEKL